MMGSGRGCLRQCETLVPRSGSATAASVNDASRPGWERALRLGVVYLGACDGGELGAILWTFFCMVWVSL